MDTPYTILYGPVFSLSFFHASCTSNGSSTVLVLVAHIHVIYMGRYLTDRMFTYKLHLIVHYLHVKWEADIFFCMNDIVTVIRFKAQAYQLLLIGGV